MIRRFSTLRSFAPLVLLLSAIALLSAGQRRTTTDSVTDKPTAVAARPYETQYVSGKVVWLDEALQRLYGVTTDPAVAQTSVVLETGDGQLLPIVPDIRGRAFAVDPQLRDTEFKLLVRRYAGVPMIQVIRLLRPKPDGLYEVDYWCDICAIPMFMLKACECCQGPTRLRERPFNEATQEAGAEGPR